MKTFKSLILFCAALAMTLWSCERYKVPVEPQATPPAWSAGSADFSSYVAIGNSLTAGFQSNALSSRDQAYSYPALLARAFHIAPANFQQPLMLEPGIGFRKKLTAFSLDTISQRPCQPRTIGPTLTDELTVNPFDPASNTNGALARPYNNLGIPGAVLFDMLDTTNFQLKSQQRANPFFAQILRSNALFGKSIVAQARALRPTFMTCWIGNNDVLGYATSGGVSPSAPTSAATFNALYRQLLDSLRSITPNVVVANIPDVTSIPYFYTVPWNGLCLTRQGQVDSLNAAYRPLGITFRLGENGFIAARGGSQPPKQLTSAEYICLTVPQDSLRAGWGSRVPIPNQYVLTSDEIAIAQSAVNAYNASIDSLARNRGFAVVNINAVLRDIASRGRSVRFSNGTWATFSTAYITGGTFSYDGVHPSSRGAVLIANEFINVINAKYGATITPLDYDIVPQLQGLGKIPEGPLGVGTIGSLDFMLNLIQSGSRR